MNHIFLKIDMLVFEYEDEEWKYAFEVNFYGPLNGVRAVLPIMRAQGGGHIVNVSSGVALSPMAFQTMYSAAKAALMAFTSCPQSSRMILIAIT